MYHTHKKEAERFRGLFLLAFAVIVSALFFKMVQPFLMALFMAAVFAGMSKPIYRWFMKRLKQRRALSAGLTLAALLTGVIVPALGLVAVLTSEAIDISQRVGPIVQEQLSHPDQLVPRFSGFLRRIPVLQDILPEEAIVIQKVGQLTAQIGGALVNSVSSVTGATVAFFFQLFIMLYATFFFLMDGEKALDRLLYLVPLRPDQETVLLQRFFSVTRATLKGTVVIGLIQGSLAAIGLAACGINGVIFWGAVMAVLSIIPAIGAAGVWFPAVIYLFATGETGAAIGLFLYCSILVGSMDNFLRPLLVGRDTEMPDLLILLSTLGGIGMFGLLGFIVGPVIAALFMTLWELYGEAFKDWLPEPTGQEFRHESPPSAES